jgi:hypothetical protein
VKPNSKFERDSKQMLAAAQLGVRGTTTMADWGEFLFILIALMIMAGAILVFLFRLVKRGPFWPGFKRMVGVFDDGSRGAG